LNHLTNLFAIIFLVDLVHNIDEKEIYGLYIKNINITSSILNILSILIKWNITAQKKNIDHIDRLGPRETSRFSGNKTNCFPWDQSLSANYYDMID